MCTIRTLSFQYKKYIKITRYFCLLVNIKAKTKRNQALNINPIKNKGHLTFLFLNYRYFHWDMERELVLCTYRYMSEWNGPEPWQAGTTRVAGCRINYGTT